jgi:hypothetical protein
MGIAFRGHDGRKRNSVRGSDEDSVNAGGAKFGSDADELPGLLAARKKAAIMTPTTYRISRAAPRTGARAADAGGQKIPCRKGERGKGV